MKTIGIIIALTVGLALASNCVTVDSTGKKSLVNCETLSSSSAHQVRSQQRTQGKLDSVSYQAELDQRIQERLRHMDQAEAQKVQEAIDAARSRNEQRKSNFLENKKD